MRRLRQAMLWGAVAELLMMAWVVLGAEATPVAQASPTNPTFAEQTYAIDLHRIGLADRAGFADQIQMGWNICNKLTDRASVAAATRDVLTSAISKTFSASMRSRLPSARVTSNAVVDGVWFISGAFPRTRPATTPARWVPVRRADRALP
jgi:hypothetical protein